MFILFSPDGMVVAFKFINDHKQRNLSPWIMVDNNYS